MNGSTSEMWLNTRMQPPSAGIFSPSIQRCFVVASRIGLTMGTAIAHAQPRLPSWSRRTVTRAGYCPVHLTERGRRLLEGWR